MIRLAALTIATTAACAPTGAVAAPAELMRAVPCGRLAATACRSALATRSVTIPVADRWRARSNATTLPRVVISKLPVIVVEYPANVRYCCRTRTSWPLIPGHSTRSPRCLPLALEEVYGVAPPLVPDAAIAEEPRPITPTSAAALAQRAKRRSTFDTACPSLSHAYGVSCRARAERVALRLEHQAIRPWSHRLRWVPRFLVI